MVTVIAPNGRIFKVHPAVARQYLNRGQAIKVCNSPCKIKLKRVR